MILIQTIARAFALLITLTGPPRLVRAVIWAALIVSASEAAAQLPTGDTSANAIFRGCKALVEDKAGDVQVYSLGNFCAGIVIGLASIGQHLSPPEWQSCAPATSDVRQLAQVVVNYIETRPERTREDFRRLTLEAFHDAWPCKSGR
jgi:Ssp1 endopeptidase immunity protein Rap1a